MREKKSTEFAPLDEKDRRILRSLQEDGRMSHLALAEKVNLSATPCVRRVRRLEEEGFIRQYVAAVDPRAAGFNVCVIVMMKLSAKTRQAAEKFTAAIAKVKAVSECHSLSGRYDYLCKVYARDVAEFESLVMSDLSQLPGLMDMESFFILSSPVDARGVPV